MNLEASVPTGSRRQGRRKARGLQTYKYAPATPQTNWGENEMKAKGSTRVWGVKWGGRKQKSF